jgi:hypothetical protein
MDSMKHLSDEGAECILEIGYNGKWYPLLAAGDSEKAKARCFHHQRLSRCAKLGFQPSAMGKYDQLVAAAFYRLFE